MQIESRTSEGHVERIRNFQLTLNGTDDAWFRITVGGQTSNKGTLEADHRVMPTEARADGVVRIRGISLALIAPFAPNLPHYDTEVEYATKKLSDALAPILTISLAAVVGFFALAIFLPMWNLSLKVK